MNTVMKYDIASVRKTLYGEIAKLENETFVNTIDLYDNKSILSYKPVFIFFSRE